MSPTTVRATDSSANEPRRLTGGKVLAMLLAFFAVIIAVNFTMAYFASKTMPGVVTKSSYEASQAFNTEIIAKANAQMARHWTVDASVVRTQNNRAVVSASFRDAAGKPQEGLEVSLRLNHTADTRRDLVFTAKEVSPGVYKGEVDGVEAGRRDLVIVATKASETLYTSKNRIDIQ